MTPAPCKDCQEREVGCHSSCQRFLGWQEKHVEEKLTRKNALLDSGITWSRRSQRKNWQNRRYGSRKRKFQGVK